MRELVKEFDFITKKLLSLLDEEKEEEMNEYALKRGEILEKIKSLNNDEEFKKIALEYDLLKSENELKEKIEKRKIYLKEELLKVNQRKNANNSYMKNTNYNNFFARRV